MYDPNNDVPSLSRQQALSCSLIGGCEGGSPTSVLNYTAYDGLMKTTLYPYVGSGSTKCKIPEVTVFLIAFDYSVHLQGSIC